VGGGAAAAAAAGWGGDRYRLWDVRGKTLLVWRTAWDTPDDAAEFRAARLASLRRRPGRERRDGGFVVFRGPAAETAVSASGPEVVVVASDQSRALRTALAALR
jgi:hypothetical protein